MAQQYKTNVTTFTKQNATSTTWTNQCRWWEQVYTDDEGFSEDTHDQGGVASGATDDEDE